MSFQCPITGRLIPVCEGTMIHRVGRYRYPQVDGVPTLQLPSRSAPELECQLEAIERGGREAVLNWLGAWSDSQGCRFDRLRRVVSASGEGGDFLHEWREYSNDPGHYFLVRWACPSFLSNLALAPLVLGRRVLDLGAGAGHFAGWLGAWEPRTRMMLVDSNLIHLLTARRYFAPQAQAVCAEMDDPLPLAEGSFDVVLMSDCFHYVERKEILLQEALRVLRPGGEILLVHVHDPRDLSGERVPGMPIEPQHCLDLLLSLCPHARWSLLAEQDLVARRAEENPMPLAEGHLPSPGPYTLRFVPDGGVGQAPAQPRFRGSDMHVLKNPIYRSRRRSNGMHLSLHWPDRPSETEFASSFLPPEVTVEPPSIESSWHELLLKGILIPDPEGRVGPPMDHAWNVTEVGAGPGHESLSARDHRPGPRGWDLLDGLETVPGWLEPEEARLLKKMARGAASGRIVELGTYMGRSTVALVAGLDTRQSQVKPVIAVDTFCGSQEHQPGERYYDPTTRTGAEGKVDTLPELSRNLMRLGLVQNVEVWQMSTLEAARRFRCEVQGEISLLFVDAGHGYEEVDRDLRAWLPHLRSDGVIVLHDVGDWAGPTRAAADLLAMGFRRLDQQGTALALTREAKGEKSDG